MIVLVSDLHLADTCRPTINVDLFLREIQRRITFAADCGVESVQLVLLGDIFEILKSKLWFTGGVRPWQTNSPTHEKTVADIFDGIVQNNAAFFHGLNDLAASQQPAVKVVYVPGNHDRPLTTAMGARARNQLKNLVPSVSWEDHFNDPFVDAEHLLLARHGHEWDPLNRYSGNTAAIGDAIVIDLLLNLQCLVTAKLGLQASDPEVEFLHEMDNVRPQNAKVLAEWLSTGLDKLIAERPNARTIFQEVCERVLEEFKSLEATSREQGTRFEQFNAAETWIKILMKAVSTFGAIEFAELMPTVSDENEILGEFAVDELAQFKRFDVECRYLVSGHTHKPALLALNARDCRSAGTPLYLNSGTWRRVHSVGSTVHGRGARSCFATWNEECVVTIYSPQEQRNCRFPAYEFSRLSRGSNV